MPPRAVLPAHLAPTTWRVRLACPHFPRFLPASASTSASASAIANASASASASAPANASAPAIAPAIAPAPAPAQEGGEEATPGPSPWAFRGSIEGGIAVQLNSSDDSNNSSSSSCDAHKTRDETLGGELRLNALGLHVARAWVRAGDVDSDNDSSVKHHERQDNNEGFVFNCGPPPLLPLSLPQEQEQEQEQEHVRGGWLAASAISHSAQDHTVTMAFPPDSFQALLLAGGNSKSNNSGRHAAVTFITVYAEFEGECNDDMAGFYRSSYNCAVRNSDSNHSSNPSCTSANTGSSSDSDDAAKLVTQYMLQTQFEPAEACRAFPCFDQPDKKAVFDISLEVPAWMTCVGNMPVRFETVLNSAHGAGLVADASAYTNANANAESSAARKIVAFEPTVVMSSYIVGFVCGDLEFIEKTNAHGVLCRVYTTSGRVDQGEFALETGARALDFFADFFGVDYPLPKMDQMAIPDFSAGAMENWGIITYRESMFLVADAPNASVAVKQEIAETVAHELAHQWFGNLVTMEWWDNLWLKEGFANFIGTFCVSELFPDWDIWADFVAKYDEMAMAMDAAESTHAIEVEVNHPDDLNEIYDSITYEKSASIIRHTRALIGAGAFRDGLVTYLKRHAYKNTVANDLFGAWSEASGRDVESLVRPFTIQPGFPLITVRQLVQDPASTSTLQLELTQARFFATGLRDDDRTRWPVPLLLRSIGKRSAASSDEFLNEKTSVVSVIFSENHENGDAVPLIKLNADQEAFYRVRYSPELTTALAAALRDRAPELTTADRVGIVSDAIALSWACLQPAQVSFELARSLANEDNFSVWSALLSGVIHLADIWDEEPTSVNLKRMLRALVRPKVKQLGWMRSQGEPDRVSLLRRSILECAIFAGDEEVIAEAKRLFAEFVKAPHDTKQATLVGIANDCVDLLYRVQVEHCGSDGFAAVRQIYIDSPFDASKEDALGALCRTPDPETAHELLDWAMTDAVRAQHKFMAFSVGRHSCRRVALDWLLVYDNYAKVFAALDASGLVARVVRLCSAHQRDLHSIDRVALFFEEHAAHKRKLVRALAQSAESVRATVRWIQHNLDAGLPRWLQENYPRAQSILQGF